MQPSMTIVFRWLLGFVLLISHPAALLCVAQTQLPEQGAEFNHADDPNLDPNLPGKHTMDITLGADSGVLPFQRERPGAR